MGVPNHRYASLGQRAIAFIIDAIILGVVAVVLMSILVVDAITSGNVGGLFIGTLVVFVLQWVYYIALEGRYGVTIGKSIIGIEVVDEAGNVPGLGPAAIRNILRIVDILPQFYIIGIILIYVNDENQRLGDMLGNTYVVRS